MTPKDPKNLKHIAIKNGNLNYSSSLDWSHAICILRFRDHTSSRYCDSWKDNSTVQVGRNASFKKEGRGGGGGGEGWVWLSTNDTILTVMFHSKGGGWGGLGHDVAIIMVNGDGQFEVGLRGGLDVNLVNSDASFKGWGKEAYNINE